MWSIKEQTGLEARSRDVGIKAIVWVLGKPSPHPACSALNHREAGPAGSCINWFLAGLRQWERRGRNSKEMGKATRISSHYSLLHVVSSCGVSPPLVPPSSDGPSHDGSSFQVTLVPECQ